MSTLSKKALILQTLVELGVPIDTQTELCLKLTEEYLTSDDIKDVKDVKTSIP